MEVQVPWVGVGVPGSVSREEDMGDPNWPIKQPVKG